MEPKITALEIANILGISLQATHKRLKNNQLNYEKSQNRIYFDHSTARELLNLSFTNQVICVQIVKGGTGKTSLTQSIAIRASLLGARVLCIDLDQQGNLTQAFGLNADDKPIMIDILKNNMSFEDAIFKVIPGVDLLPSRIENAVLDTELMLNRHPLDKVYKVKIDELKNKYDLILIDCPPALGTSVTAATLASDTILSPITPEKFCYSGLKITYQEMMNIQKAYKVEKKFKILLNKYDSRTTLSHEVLSTLVKHPVYGDCIYRCYIRLSQEFPNVVAKGISIFDSLRSSIAKEDIDLLTLEILNISREDNENKVELGRLEEIAE